MISLFSRCCDLFHAVSVIYWMLWGLQPRYRDVKVFDVRSNAAKLERDGTGLVCQVNNGDTDLAAKFHKTLPHNELGQVILHMY